MSEYYVFDDISAIQTTNSILKTSEIFLGNRHRVARTFLDTHRIITPKEKAKVDQSPCDASTYFTGTTNTGKRGQCFDNLHISQAELFHQRMDAVLARTDPHEQESAVALPELDALVQPTESGAR